MSGNTEAKKSPLRLLQSGESEKFIFGAGVLIRLLLFAVMLIIGARDIDETMTGLNASSLACGGTDIFGQSFPVYFNTWLVGGQSPLSTYFCAASMRIFGSNLFALRLPALLVSLASFFVFYRLAGMLFKNRTVFRACVFIEAMGGMAVFNSAYQLDCNWMNYCLVFALFFFVKAVKSEKKLLLLPACVFFSLCFYSYIASVLIVPVIMLGVYLFALKKRKLTFVDCLLSAAAVLVMTAPFLAVLLNIIGVVPPFSVGKITVPDMEHYIRFNSISGSGLLSRLLMTVFDLLMPFVYYEPISAALHMSAPLYEVMVIFGGLSWRKPIYHLKEFRKFRRLTEEKDGINMFIIPIMAGIVLFCLLSGTPIKCSYRYGAFGSLLSLVLARPAAFNYLSSELMRKHLKKIILVTPAAVLVCLAVTSAIYAETSLCCADWAHEACDYLNSEQGGKTVYICMPVTDENGEIDFLRFQDHQMISAEIRSCYDNKGFISFKDEQMQRYGYGYETLRISDRFVFVEDIETAEDKNGVVILFSDEKGETEPLFRNRVCTIRNVK